MGVIGVRVGGSEGGGVVEERCYERLVDVTFSVEGKKTIKS